MGAEIGEVMNSVINIDKSAAELRLNLQKQIKEKENKLNNEAAVMKEEITGNKKAELKKYEDEALKDANAKAKDILDGAKTECSKMYEKFTQGKKSFYEEMFNQIFINNGLRN